MKSLIVLATSLLGLALLITGSVTADPKSPSAKLPTTQSLKFLAGAWHAKKWGGDFHAYYSTGEGGKLLSHSTLIREGKVAFHEFEVFEVRDGKLTVHPHPGGQPAARFSATQIKKNEVAFDNPKNDFPTRITYALASPDVLRITLSDPHHNSPKTDVFELKRVKPKK